MSEISTTEHRERTVRVIKLADDDLVPRRDFAGELGVSERTTLRMDLPTTYIGNVAYILRGASLQIIAESVRRRHQSRQTIRLRHRTPRANADKHATKATAAEARS